MKKIKATIQRWWQWWNTDPIVGELQIHKAEKIIKIAKTLTVINVIAIIGQVLLFLAKLQ